MHVYVTERLLDINCPSVATFLGVFWRVVDFRALFYWVLGYCGILLVVIETYRLELAVVLFEVGITYAFVVGSFEGG